MTRGDLRTIVRQNLSDTSAAKFSDLDINTNIQNWYNFIVEYTKCITKTNTNISPLVNSNFIKLSTYISDYSSCIAIYNQLTQRWLLDDCNFNLQLPRDWEREIGSLDNWMPYSIDRIAIYRKLTSVTALDKLSVVYTATAPSLANDNSIFDIAGDMVSILEYGATALMLESIEEFTKSQIWNKKVFPKLEDYKARCANLAKHDMIYRN